GAFLLQDRFSCRNQFYGGQLGARAAFRSGAFSLAATGKVALGATQEVLEVRGRRSQALTGGGTSILSSDVPGGFFALPTNSGRAHKSEFSVLPEVGVQVGYSLTEQVRLFAGYNFLYLSNVLRPGSQIDPTLNVGQLTSGAGAGPIAPLRRFDQ